jgi:large subunit ribosomal protein L30
MATIKIRQTKSGIGRPESQIKILKALKLGRIGKVSELPDVESVRGMTEKVKHLVEIQKL